MKCVQPFRKRCWGLLHVATSQFFMNEQEASEGGYLILLFLVVINCSCDLVDKIMIILTKSDHPLCFSLSSQRTSLHN